MFPRDVRTATYFQTKVNSSSCTIGCKRQNTFKIVIAIDTFRSLASEKSTISLATRLYFSSGQFVLHFLVYT